jgi:hypothetical protein
MFVTGWAQKSCTEDVGNSTSAAPLISTSHRQIKAR